MLSNLGFVLLYSLVLDALDSFSNVVSPDIDRPAVVVDKPVLLLSQGVHVGVDDDLGEGHEEVEDAPDVHHLDVVGLGQPLTDADEEGGLHQQGGEVDGDDGLKEESLEVVGGEGYEAEDHHGEVDGQEGAEDATAKLQLNLNCAYN